MLILVVLLLAIMAVACALWLPFRQLVRLIVVMSALAVMAGFLVLVWAFTPSEQRLAMGRIAKTEVQLGSLQLVPRPGSYMLRGFVRNLSSRYTLTDVTFELIAEDCVASQCGEQARGHAEVIRHVRPGETIGFDTQAVWMPYTAAARGEQRLSYHIWNTWAIP